MDRPETTKHAVRWEVDGFEGVTPEFTCTAEVGEQCRLHCPDGCESYSYRNHEHTLVDAGECMFLPWLTTLDKFDLQDTYAGVRHEAVAAPVVLKYEDEWVVWWYADDEKTNAENKPPPAQDHPYAIGPKPQPAMFKTPATALEGYPEGNKNA